MKKKKDTLLIVLVLTWIGVAFFIIMKGVVGPVAGKAAHAIEDSSGYRASGQSAHADGEPKRHFTGAAE